MRAQSIGTSSIDTYLRNDTMRWSEWLRRTLSFQTQHPQPRRRLRVQPLEERVTPATIVIDTFEAAAGGQNVVVSAVGPASNNSQFDAAYIFGGERDIQVNKLNGPDGPIVQGLETGGSMNLNTPLNVQGTMTIVWDGNDNSNTLGLGLGLSLTGRNRMIIDAQTDITGQGSQLQMVIVDTAGNSATSTQNVPTTNTLMEFDVQAFAGIGAVNLASIARIEMRVLNVPAAGDIEIRLISVTSEADLNLTKTISPAGPYAVGDVITYTVTVNNTSTTGEATQLVVFDAVPAQLSSVVTTPSQGSYVLATGLWSVGTLLPTQSATLTITGTINATGTITNLAEINSFDGTDPDSTPGNRGTTTAEDDTGIVTITAVGVDFGDAPTAAQSGFAGTYPTTLADGGARHTASGPTLGAARDTEANGQPNAAATGDDTTGTDDEDGVTLGTLTPGSNTSALVVASAAGFLNAWVDFNRDGDWSDAGEQIATNRPVSAGTNAVPITVPAGAVLGNSYARFRLTASSVGVPAPGGALPTGEVEDYQVTIAAALLPDLSLTKTVDNATPTLGENVAYTLTLTNESANPATGVVVRDLLPAGVSFVSATPSSGSFVPATGLWTIGAFAGNAVATLAITVTVVGSGTINNATEVIATTPGDSDSSPGNGSTTEDDDAAVPITVAAVDFGDAPNSYGTLLAANGARHIATGVTLGGARDSEANGAPNGTATGDDTAGTDDEDGVTFPAYPNGAALTRGTTDTVNVNASGAGFLNAWIDFNNSGTFEGTEQIANNLPVIAGVNSLSVIIPGGATLANTFARFRITDTSVVTPSPVGQSPTGEVEDYQIQIVDRADLSLTKTTSNPTPDIGDSVTFTVTVTNGGPNGATGVTVLDLLPAGLSFSGFTATQGAYVSGTGIWTVGALANGASATLTITATVTASGTIVNRAEINADGQFDPDSTPGNSSTTEDDDDSATLTVPALDFGDAPATYGTLIADNGARHRATGPILGPSRDSENNGVPTAGATGDGADENGVTFGILTQGVSNTVPVAVTGAVGNVFVNAWIDFNVDGDFLDAGEQVLTNTSVANGTTNTGIAVPLLASPTINTFARVRISSVAGTGPLGLATDGEVEDYAVVLRQQADLSLTKTTSNPTPDLGEQIVYTITVTNGGPNPATNVTIRDALPAGVSYVSDNSGGAYASGTGLWTVGTLANGASAALQITVRVVASGVTVNSAVVQTSDQFDPDSTPGTPSTTEDDDDTTTITVPFTDFGDAPTAAQSGITGTYPTTLVDDGARHRSLGVFMGASRDSENDGQPNTTATGDGGDENGVTFGPTVTIGTTQTIQITASGSGFVNAWIDYNRDGDWADAGEQILTNAPVVNGLNSFVIIVPVTAAEGTSYTRFRITDATVATPAPTGLLPTGEVEDYQVTLLRSDDFGDAPDTYGTLLASNGPRHVNIGIGPRLGATVDTESEGQPNATATGDGADEDGVTLPTLTQGVTSTITVSAPNGGRLDAFIDFNNDGDFLDTGERITPVGGTFLTPGSNTLNVTTPIGATPSTTFARFRVSTVGNLDPAGGANDGEVEDYQVTIQPGNGTFGDRVWNDLDGDGTQDVGEPGLSGATVTAVWAGPNGTPGDGDDQTFTTTTDLNGNYSFIDVPPGNYQVTVTDTPGSVNPTADPDGIATPNTATITLPPLGNLTTIDFGYQGTLTVGNRVWHDVDNDGTQDVDEPGFVGVDVTLTYAGPNGTFGDGDDFTATTTTVADGAYTFTNLPQGLYRITVDATDLPPTPVATFDADGAGTANIATLTVTASRDDVDFGYRGSVSIGNLVFNDVNNNGINNADSAVPDVVLELVQGATVLATTTTGPGGLYAFTGLFDGDYQVRIAASNFQLGGSLVGFTGSAVVFDPNNNANDDNNGAVSGVLGAGGFIISGTITLAAGTEPTFEDGDNNTNITLDFGVYAQHSAGNLIFEDTNNNGTRDAGEPGVDGVSVRLLDATGTTQLATTTTSGGGFYFFPNLIAGTYIIEIAATNFGGVLAGYRSSTGNAGNATPTPFEGVLTPDPDADATDNDDNGTTVGGAIRSLPFTIDNTEPTGETPIDPSGALDNFSNFTIDFGVMRLSQFGNRVWLDNDGDGTQDAGEPGIGGATVTAVFAGIDGTIGTPDDVTFTTTTTLNGDYQFTNVPAGLYQVAVTNLPVGIAPTFDRDGTGTPNTAQFTLAPSTPLTDVNFGYQGTLTLGDRVWYDLDGDTVQDLTETGFTGVDVTLVFAGINNTFGDADDFTATTTTGANGAYTFANLPAGQYLVTVDVNDLPAGRVPTFDVDGLGSANAATVTVTASRDDVDFGYRGSLSIGDQVFDDINNNGTQDGEVGLVGVAVELLQGPNVFATGVTGAGGVYTFSGLFAGTYQVRLAASNFQTGGPLVGFTSSTLTNDTEANPADNDDNGGIVGTLGSGGVIVTSPVTLSVGGEPTGEDGDANTNLTVDFGVYSQFSVGNLVFNDFNNDGVRQATEPGLDGVSVRLLDGTTLNPIATTTTAGGGFYVFAGLIPGTYVVEIAASNFSGVLTNFRSSTGNPGSTPPTTPFEGGSTPDPDTVATDNDDNGTTTGTVIRSLPFTLDTTEPTTETEADASGTLNNQSNFTVDFGVVQLGAIGDRVWNDLDGGGTQDVGEPGLGGVTVTAVYAGPNNIPGDGDDQTFTTTTDLNGNYTLTNIPAGQYTVTVTPPAATTPTFDRDGLGTPNAASFTLAPNATLTDVDFGYRGTLTLGDRVWYDLDNDGTQDVGETGITGATVTLVAAGANGIVGDADDFTLTTTTGANGLYSFPNLPAGNYTVSVTPTTLPAGATPTFDLDGIASPNTTAVTLTTSQADVDFGYRGSLTLGNLVFNDADNSGTSNGTEAGLTGVVVELLQGSTVLATTTTTATGEYTFPGLFEGTYTVRLAATNFLVGGALVGFLSSTTTANAETNPTDNDDNGNVVGTLGTPGGVITSDPVTLTLNGEPTTDDGDNNTNNTVDFGVFSPNSIGNLVFHDRNNNGIRDASDNGVDGVLVRLLDATGTTELATSTTNGGGFYYFPSVVPGTYVLEIAASNFGGVLAGFRSSTGNPGFATPTPFEDGTTPDADTVDADNDDNGTTVGGAIRSLPFDIDATEPTNETETDPNGVPNNQSNLTLDFGVVQLASFGDRVWLDNDGDGTQDAGEPGIGGATVTAVYAGANGVFGDGDDFTINTPTDVNGNYTFVNMPAGQYRVTVSGTPASTTPTADPDGLGTPNTATITVTATSRTDVDFGYRGTLTIGDRVWYDLDNDGVQDAGETGLSGATVNVVYAGVNGTFGDSDDFTISATTGANGLYTVPNLPAGQYQVSVVTASLPAGATPTGDLDGVGTPNTATLTLTANRDDVDFGYRGSLVLGDVVFNDINNNGTNDGEAGLANVVVELVQNTTVIATATTTATGTYTFTGLFDGTYTVRLAATNFLTGGPLVNFTSSTITADPETNPTDNDDNGAIVGTLGTPGGVIAAGPVTLVTGAEPTTEDGDANTNNTVDFGVFSGHSIGNLVFNDLNNSGTRDAGELGIDGVLVRLLDATGNVQLATTTTAGGGFYVFSGLTAGTYIVELPASNFSGVLAGFVSSTGNPGVATPRPFEGPLTPSPDTNTDNDDNGTTISGAVRTLTVAIDATEPTTETETDPTGTLNNQSNFTVDFGMTRLGAFGNRVWLDNDGDGTQDTGEPGLIGATVTAVFAGIDNLLGNGDDQTFTTTTDVNGNYTFVNMPVGNYRVTVTGTPATTTPTFDRDGVATPGTATFTLPLNTTLTDVNFGYRGTLSLGDRVWYDLDNDGTQDVGETGITGVTVTLVYAGVNGIAGDADDFTLTATTGANGLYSFPNLPAGNYTISVDPNTLPSGATPTFDLDGIASANSTAVTLAATQTDVDFGYRGSLTLGNSVFNDLNNNGTRDGADAGLANVVVELIQNTTVLATDTTTATGEYTFAGLFEGAYQVRLAASNFVAGGPLANFTSSTLTVDPETPTDNDDNGSVQGVLGGTGTIITGTVNLTFNGEPTTDDGDANTNNTVDFGVFTPSSAGNLVFNDINNNGVKDTNEVGIDGVTVRLLDAAGTTQIATTTTAAGGFYYFGNLTPGTYVIELAASNFSGVLAGFSSSTGNPGFATPTPFEGAATPDADTTPTDNDDNGTTIGNVIRSLPFDIAADEPTGETDPDPNGVPDNQSNLTIDFGVVRLGTFGDRVWLDNDGDGTQDAGEPGIGDATVTAVFAGADNVLGTPDDLTLTTTTDLTGNYTFVNAPAGQYRVTVTGAPASTTPTFDRDGTGTPNTATFTLPASTTLTDVDFGYRGTLSLGDRVWYDLNGNGTQEAAETGFTGVTVNLTYAGVNGTPGDADDFTLTATTGANGVYNFANLPAGNYTVGIAPATLPTGATPTFDLDGIATANTTAVVLSAARTDVDFGYRGSLTLGNVVFNDLNNNGTNDGEAGIANVAVELLQNATVIATATTSATGIYTFPGLLDGTYQVRLAATNFLAGSVLANFTSSTATADPETNPTDNDDNGSVQGTLGTPGGVIIAGAVTLVTGGEPTADDGDANTNLTVDFGVFSGHSIGNLVFNDLNNNGTRDSGENGIDGVTVRLLDATGTTQVATTTTSGGGFYVFNNLPAGTYVLELPASNFSGVLTGFSSSTGNPGFATPTPFEGAATPDPDTAPTDNDDNGTTTGGAVRSAAVTTDANEPTTETETDATGTPNNQSNFTVDFALVQKGRLVGTVFLDTNTNGILDPGESTGIPNVSITATGPNGTFTTTTDTNGAYAFENIPAGNYTVTETQPNGYGSSSPNTLSPVVVPANGTGTANFGETTGSLTGRVWLNYNNQPDFNGPDAPIAGVTITLAGTDANGVAVNRTTLTDANGNYSFTNIVGGTYTVTETQPTGGTFPNNADGLDFIVAPAPGTTTNDVHSLTFPAAATLTGYNFTEIPRTSLSGVVYHDLNNNGTRDTGEPGITGVPVTLSGTDVSGAVVNTTVNTDATGTYTFPNILPSTNYIVTEGTVPSPFIDGKETNGTPAATDTNTNDVFGGINLTNTPASASGGATGFNFGEVQPVTISGSVYLDANSNGLREGTETGIAGVPIRLTGTDDLGAPVSTLVSTDASGNYNFANIRPGVYTVTEVTQPAGLSDGLDTPGTRGGSTAVNDVISGIVMNSGTTSTDNNFGESNKVDIQITQSVNKSVVKVGGKVIITYVVKNNGPSDANDVVMVAKLPSGMSYSSTNFIQTGTYAKGTGTWTIGPLGAGEEAILRVVAKVNRAGTFANDARVTTSNSETTLVNNFSQIDVVAAVSVTQVTKKNFLSSGYF